MSDTTTLTRARPVARRFPLRWLGGVLVLLLCFTAYLDRIAFSVTAASSHAPDQRTQARSWSRPLDSSPSASRVRWW